MARAGDGWVKKAMGAVGLRTVLELRGQAIHTMETEPAARQSCCCSRSFGEATTDRGQVGDAVLTFASRSAEKVRRDNLVSGAVQVFLSTDRYRINEPQYSWGLTVRLTSATSDTPRIIGAALAGLERVWKDGFAIRKAGVILIDLVDPANVPRDLFSPPAPLRPRALMAALDGINGKFGRGAAAFGLVDKEAPWQMRQERKSPSYTSNWDAVSKVRA